MPFPVDFFACRNDPNSDECERTRRFFSDLLEAQYLSKLLNSPKFHRPFPLPDPGPFSNDPTPQPYISTLFENQGNLLGELLMHALDPVPETNMPSLIKEIKDSGVQLEVVRDLIQKFEKSITILKEEAEKLEKHCC